MKKTLRRADHSSRGVLPTVLRRCVWSRNIKNEEAMTRVGSQRHSKKTKVRRDGYLQRLYRDARSTEHKNLQWIYKIGISLQVTTNSLFPPLTPRPAGTLWAPHPHTRIHLIPFVRLDRHSTFIAEEEWFYLDFWTGGLVVTCHISL